MHLLVVDADRQILGDKDISGTTWEVTYNGQFNQHAIGVTCCRAGRPWFVEVRDDTLSLVVTRLAWQGTDWLAVGDGVSIARGKFVWTPLVIADGHMSGAMTTEQITDIME